MGQMTGFFFDIRNRPVGGRFFALLLRELAFHQRADRAVFARLWGLSKEQTREILLGNAQIEKEWKIPNGSNKRADIAILIGGEPIFLIEIKEDDINNKDHNTAQIQNYAHYVKSSNGMVGFAYVTRYRPDSNDAAYLDDLQQSGHFVRVVYYKEILDIVRQCDTVLARMLVDYMEDIGVASYKLVNIEDERREVSFMLIQLLGFPHKTGMRRLNSKKAVREMPGVIDRLFQNLEVVSEWVKIAHPTFRFNRGMAPRQFLEKGRVLKSLKDEDDESVYISNEYVTGGEVYFWSYSRIDSGKGWCILEFGYKFEIDRNPEDISQPFSLYIYAEIRGQGLKNCYVEKNVKSFPSEIQMLSTVKALIAKAANKAIKQEKHTTDVSVLLNI